MKWTVIQGAKYISFKELFGIKNRTLKRKVRKETKLKSDK
jgi:hypothetical protein